MRLPNDRGEAPLHLAAASHNAHLHVTKLLAGGADAHARDGNGDTPLHRAATLPRWADTPERRATSLDADTAIVGTLLRAGADVNARNDAG